MVWFIFIVICEILYLGGVVIGSFKWDSKIVG